MAAAPASQKPKYAGWAAANATPVARYGAQTVVAPDAVYAAWAYKGMMAAEIHHTVVHRTFPFRGLRGSARKNCGSKARPRASEARAVSQESAPDSVARRRRAHEASPRLSASSRAEDNCCCPAVAGLGEKCVLQCSRSAVRERRPKNRSQTSQTRNPARLTNHCHTALARKIPYWRAFGKIWLPVSPAKAPNPFPTVSCHLTRATSPSRPSPSYLEVQATYSSTAVVRTSV